MVPVRNVPSFARRSERTETVLEEIEAAAALSPAATGLIDLAFIDDHGAADLLAFLRNHEALAAKLLAGYQRVPGSRGGAPTLSAIVDAVGVERLWEAALALEVAVSLCSSLSGPAGGLDRAGFWRHSLAAACAARLLAGQVGSGDLERRAYVGGFLHDMGKMALATCFPKSYARVLRRVRCGTACICDAEQEVLGVDHTVAGRRLLSSWNLPRSVRDCAWLHHHPLLEPQDTVENPRLLQIVNLADNLVRRLRIGYSGYGHVDTAAACRVLGVPTAVLERVGAEIGARLAPLEVFVELGCRAGAEPAGEPLPAFAEVLRAGGGGHCVTRQPSFRAVSTLIQALRGDEDAGAVCRCIAESLAEAFALPSVVAFALPRRADRCVAAFWVNGEAASETIALDERQVPAYDTFSRAHGGGGRRIGAPHPAFSPIELRFARILGGGEGTIRMLLLVHAGQLVGGALFAASPESADLLAAPADDLHALSAALGWTIAGAQDRREAARMAEALACSNRAFHVAQLTRPARASMGMMVQMAAGAAHELNDPLAVIAGRAQMLRRDVRGTALEPQLKLLDEQARRASGIVSELVQFAKPDPPRPRLVSVVDWARRLRQHWQRRSSLRADQVEVTISDAALRMYVDVEQLDEAAGAIIANAIEAMTPEKARLSINSASVASDDIVVVSIGDNGRGMSPEVLEHACDPFFSHRSAGRGRGLGLSRAARLLEINAGRLRIESSPEAGTTVFLSVPARAP